MFFVSHRHFLCDKVSFFITIQWNNCITLCCINILACLLARERDVLTDTLRTFTDLQQEIYLPEMKYRNHLNYSMQRESFMLITKTSQPTIGQWQSPWFFQRGSIPYKKSCTAAPWQGVCAQLCIAAVFSNDISQFPSSQVPHCTEFSWEMCKPTTVHLRWNCSVTSDTSHTRGCIQRGDAPQGVTC